MKTRPVFVTVVIALLCSTPLIVNGLAAQQQRMDSLNSERVNIMLEVAYIDVKKNYYDTTFHGLDWDARHRDYKEKMKQATSLGQGFAVVAGFLDGLNDSHTFFQPPNRPVRVEYGFQIMIVGERAFITRVRPGTDAETKVHPGDEVVAYNRFTVNRDSLWKMDYYFDRLSPRGDAELVLKDPAGREREIKVEALDLRDNPGGAVVTLDHMLGNVFEEDVKIADRKGRKELKPQLAKGRGKNAFTGKIVVLVDSGSASAAELFARVMQLEKRGTVVGDRSSGSVMESRRYAESQGVDAKVFYGFSITEADHCTGQGADRDASPIFEAHGS
jgi:hypothetical protein